MSPAVKCHDFLSGTGTERNDGLSVGGLIVCECQHIIQTLQAGRIQEPFAIWTRQAFERVVTERGDDEASTIVMAREADPSRNTIAERLASGKGREGGGSSIVGPVVQPMRRKPDLAAEAAAARGRSGCRYE